MKPITRFNIRVYGIWINEKDQVLLSDEIIHGRKITKFPGGGMEFCEGPADCIKREWKEELGTDIDIIRQFYFTDFFVPSFMDDGSQVISIYFEVKPVSELMVPLKSKLFDFNEEKEGIEVFRMKDIHDLTPKDVTFPIDQKVVKMLTGFY